MLADALRNLSEAEAEVVWHAIAQFVENGRDALEHDEPGDDTARTLPIAEAILERLDAAKAALAA